MILVDEALKRIHAAASEKQEAFLKQNESLSVEPNHSKELMGRILARDVVANEFIPPFHNSSMDGFALCSEATLTASASKPVSFLVLGVVYAGQVFDETIKLTPDVAVEIMTGAPMPSRFDAVVKIEDVELVKNSSGVVESIKIFAPLQAKENLREKGTDFHPGQLLLKKKSRISSEHVLGFATVGVSKVQVMPKPKIALLSTGNELVDDLSETLSGGMIRNATAPYLMSAVPFFGAEGKFYGTVKDEAEGFKETIRKILLDQPDVIITTGAVSKGKLDFVPDALRALGAEVQFHGIAIRPGKPLLFAKFKDGPVVFAVPGNPVATAVALRFFVYPYLAKLQGLPEEIPTEAHLSHLTYKAQGLRCFWKGVLTHSLNGTEVESLSGQESYRVSSLMPANSWIVLPEAGDEVAAKTVVKTYPLYPKSIALEGDVHEGECC